MEGQPAAVVLQCGGCGVCGDQGGEDLQWSAHLAGMVEYGLISSAIGMLLLLGGDGFLRVLLGPRYGGVPAAVGDAFVEVAVVGGAAAALRCVLLLVGVAAAS